MTGAEQARARLGAAVERMERRGQANPADYGPVHVQPVDLKALFNELAAAQAALRETREALGEELAAAREVVGYARAYRKLGEMAAPELDWALEQYDAALARAGEQT